MKIKKTLAAILTACALLNIAGCSENQGKKETTDLVIGNVDDPNDGEPGSAEVTKTQYSPITLSENNTLNSIRLFDAISKDKENAMFSPLSLNMALGLIEAGAEGDTKAALDSYLQTENFADFAESYMKRAREGLTWKTGKQNNVLEIANSLWADNALPLKDDYKQNIGGKFGAEIKNLDFGQKDSALNEINGWVSEKTHKMIPSILKDYGSDTMAVLINTVYFESAWREEWDIDERYKETFTLLDGTTKKIPFMSSGNEQNDYYENDKATAFSCGYNNGLKFIGILPKNEGEFTLESLDIPTLLEGKDADHRALAIMPRLNFETALGLKDALSAAGLENIFDGNTANFSGISEGSLYVSEILQKTKLELDEKRTRASAGTGAAMNFLSMPKESKTVRLDRPFAFMIYDPAEDQILFVGKVTNP